MTAKKSKKEKKGEEKIKIGRDVNINNGDFVAGDRVTMGDKSVYAAGDIEKSTVVTGDNNDLSKTLALREELFDDIFKKIDDRPSTSTADKEDLKANVEEIKTEAEKGDEADETFLGRRIRNILRIAPDILEVVTSTIANPAAGFTTVVKKIVEKARASTESGQAEV